MTGAYSGPDKEGFYPLFKMGTEKPERIAAVASTGWQPIA